MRNTFVLFFIQFLPFCFIMYSIFLYLAKWNAILISIYSHRSHELDRKGRYIAIVDWFVFAFVFLLIRGSAETFAILLAYPPLNNAKKQCMRFMNQPSFSFIIILVKIQGLNVRTKSYG